MVPDSGTDLGTDSGTEEGPVPHGLLQLHPVAPETHPRTEWQQTGWLGGPEWDRRGLNAPVTVGFWAGSRWNPGQASRPHGAGVPHHGPHAAALAVPGTVSPWAQGAAGGTKSPWGPAEFRKGSTEEMTGCLCPENRAFRARGTDSAVLRGPRNLGVWGPLT